MDSLLSSGCCGRLFFSAAPPSPERCCCCSLCFPPLPYSWVRVEKDADATDSPRRDEYPLCTLETLLHLRNCRDTLMYLDQFLFRHSEDLIRSRLAHSHSGLVSNLLPLSAFSTTQFYNLFYCSAPTQSHPQLTRGDGHTTQLIDSSSGHFQQLVE